LRSGVLFLEKKDLRGGASAAFSAFFDRRDCAFGRGRCFCCVGSKGSSIALGGEAFEAVDEGTGTRRDQAANDDVLFKADEFIGLAVDRRFRENTRGLLEGRGRDERARLQSWVYQPKKDLGT